jgi:hypothetical protein
VTWLRIRNWLHTSESLIQSLVTPCDIHGGRSASPEGFSPSSFGFSSVTSIPPLVHTHLPPPPPPEIRAIILIRQHSNTSPGTSILAPKHWLVTE